MQLPRSSRRFTPNMKPTTPCPSCGLVRWKALLSNREVTYRCPLCSGKHGDQLMERLFVAIFGDLNLDWSAEDAEEEREERRVVTAHRKTRARRLRRKKEHAMKEVKPW